MRRQSVDSKASNSNSLSGSRKNDLDRPNPPEQIGGKRTTRSSSNGSSQTQPDPTVPPQIQATASEISAIWNGKLLIIRGLSEHHFPTNTPLHSLKQQNARRQRGSNGRYFTGNHGPSPSGLQSQRFGLKRKRSALNGSSDGLNGHEDYDSDDLDESDEGASPSKKAQEEDYTFGSGPSQSRASPIKRRRRGVNAQSQAASRAPSPPPLPMLASDEDILSEIDLPEAYLSREPTPDPNDPVIADPDDEAHKIYKDSYAPLPKVGAFINALTKFNPAQRSTENLYTLAANTALALRTWQDEYLVVDRLIAPHAAIPRKAATGARLPLDPTVFEDMKEADLYDYVFDLKKPGRQDPIAQRVLRDASGRELRQRAPRGRVGADGLVAAAAAMAGDEDGGKRRARRPVSKYDGVAGADANGVRKRGLGSTSEPPEGDPQPAKRGRWSGGRGSRGGGRGGRGRGGASLLGKRIREMREQSAMTATTDEESGSEAGSAAAEVEREYSASLATEQDHPDTSAMPNSHVSSYNDGEGYGTTDHLRTSTDRYIYSEAGVEGEPETAEAAAAAAAAQKRKGRPKGSKNLHKRSDAGIPKGPRAPKPTAAGGGTSGAGSPAVEPTAPPAVIAASGSKVNKAPKSDKRSQSMTDWWAKRKAAEAEKRIKDLKDSGGSVPTVSSGPALPNGAPVGLGPYQQPMQYQYATGPPIQMSGPPPTGYAPHPHHYTTAPPGPRPGSGSGGYVAQSSHGITLQQHQNQMQVLGPDGRAMQLVDPEGRPMRVLGTSADGSSMQVVGPDGRAMTIQVQVGPPPPHMPEYSMPGQVQRQSQAQGQHYMGDNGDGLAERDRIHKDKNGFARSF